MTGTFKDQTAMSRSSVQSVLAVAYLAVLLSQVLRNYSSLYFVALFLVLASLTVTTAVPRPTIKRGGQSFSIYFVFFMLTIWVCFWSFLYNPAVDVLNTIGRLFFITSLPIILLLFRSDEKFVQAALRLYVYMYLIAVLSYLYQFQFGAIEWFSDEPMERGSVFRFSTTLGSGNIYGIGLGVALLFASTLEFNKLIKVVIIVSLLLGAVMSMQKAAVMNVAVWIAIYVSIFNRKGALRIAGFSALILAIAIAYSYGFKESLFSVYFQEFIFNSVGLNLFDNPGLVKSTVLDADNVVERLLGVNIPEIISAHNSQLLFLVGIGTTGVGGGMGMPQYPQSHSTYWDLLFMGGVFYLLSYIFLLISLLRRLAKLNSRAAVILFWAIIIYSINAVAATAAIFHPVLSLPVWISLIMVSNKFENDARRQKKPQGNAESEYRRLIHQGTTLR